MELDGKNFRHFRVEHGWSQAELGRRARITQTRVSEIERGLPARPDETKRLLKALTGCKR